jgi:hypothetical protein
MEKQQVRTLRWALIGVVAVLVSCGDGSSNASTVTGVEDEYNVGDTGPGGGIIVYVDEAGFDNSSGGDTSIGAMCLTGTCHYLEMAPTELEGQYPWDDAMVAAEEFSTPSANDWVLPSKDALNEMCKYWFVDARSVICNDDSESSLALRLSGFSTDGYWSSSEYGVSSAWGQIFLLGGQSNTSKLIPAYVRPVRAF